MNAIDPDRDPLIRRAQLARALLARYRDLDPVIAFSGLGLQPALQAYLRCPPAVGHTPDAADAADAAGRAGGSQLLRLRIDLWATLLSRDIPDYLGRGPAAHGPAEGRALSERARRMIALVEARRAAGRPLPYGVELCADLRAALHGFAPSRAQARVALQRELATLRKLLMTLLPPGHPDARALCASGPAVASLSPPAAEVRGVVPTRRAG